MDRLFLDLRLSIIESVGGGGAAGDRCTAVSRCGGAAVAAPGVSLLLGSFLLLLLVLILLLVLVLEQLPEVGDVVIGRAVDGGFPHGGLRRQGVTFTLTITMPLSRVPPPPQLELLAINRRSCTITEKAPTRAFSWLKVANTNFTFKTLLRHYAKWALTPW